LKLSPHRSSVKPKSSPLSPTSSASPPDDKDSNAAVHAAKFQCSKNILLDFEEADASRTLKRGRGEWRRKRFHGFFGWCGEDAHAHRVNVNSSEAVDEPARMSNERRRRAA